MLEKLIATAFHKQNVILALWYIRVPNPPSCPNRWICGFLRAVVGVEEENEHSRQKAASSRLKLFPWTRRQL